MESITFHCKVITPMFLAGADGQTPELRAPSIKGAMRFWWRALNGHLVKKNEETGEWDYSELKTREVKIFGGSIGEQSFKSRLSIRIPAQPQSGEISNEVWKEANYGKRTSQKTGKPYFASKGNRESLEGLGYLFYSTWLDGENPRKAIMPNSQFQVTFRFLEKEYVDDVLKALKCLMIFGGLGTRIRRGAGSFEITGIEECTDDKLQRQFEKMFLKDSFSSIEGLADIIKDIEVREHECNLYSHLSKAYVFLFESANTWQYALEKIGRPFKKFRNLEKGNIDETPNFGFPIVHSKSNTTMQAGKQVVDERGREKLDKLERRSSPLIFKVFRGNDDQYYPFIIWLNGELLPDGYKIMDKYGGNDKEASTEIIDDFIYSLESTFIEEIKL